MLDHITQPAPTTTNGRSLITDRYGNTTFRQKYFQSPIEIIDQKLSKNILIETPADLVKRSTVVYPRSYFSGNSIRRPIPKITLRLHISEFLKIKQKQTRFWCQSSPLVSFFLSLQEKLFETKSLQNKKDAARKKPTSNEPDNSLLATRVQGTLDVGS